MHLTALLAVAVGLACCAAAPPAAAAAAAGAPGPSSIHQPRYHIFAPDGWINDPNGMFQHRGRTHVFFQYNPHGAVWGSIHWGHVVSEDLVRWRWLPPALAPDTWYDARGCFSGSATVPNGSTPVLLYTAVSGDANGTDFQRQALAVPADPDDPSLVSWSKPASINPIISDPPPGGDPLQFRDPTTAWTADLDHLDPPVRAAWVAAVGVQDDCVGGAALYYATNLTSGGWRFLGTLASQLSLNPNVIRQCMSKDPDQPVLGRHRAGLCDPLGPCQMWECPDMFSLQGIQVVKWSDQARGRAPESLDWYLLGDPPLNYSAERVQDEADAFTARVRGKPYAPQLWDLGSVYASKTFLTTDNRRLWLGWAYETSAGCSGVCGAGSAFTASEGWQGALTLPREVRLNADTMTLTLYPPVEVQLLRKAPLVHRMQQDLDASGAAAALVAPSTPAAPANVSAARRREVQLRFFPPSAAEAQAHFGGARGDGGGVLGVLPYTASLQLLLGGAASATVSLSGSMEWRAGAAPRVLNMTLSVDRARAGGATNATWQGGPVPLSASGAYVSLQLSVWLDHSVLEAYALWGAARLTSRLYPSDPGVAWGLAASADYGMPGRRGRLSADVWPLKSGWVEWPQTNKTPQAAAAAAAAAGGAARPSEPPQRRSVGAAQVAPFVGGALLALGFAVFAAWDVAQRYRGYQRLSAHAPAAALVGPARPGWNGV